MIGLLSLTVLNCGCINFGSNSSTTPSNMQIGSKGDTPTKVWQDYDWVIKSVDLEIGVFDKK